jgi:TPR repeat protein
MVDDSEARAALIATARTMMTRGGSEKFSLARLYAESGVSRAVFRRCFDSKAALMATLVGDDVQALGAIAEAMTPAIAMKVAVGQNSAAAPVDAWLERRLRVFERALAGLESRQDKSERAVLRELSLLNEKLGSPAQSEPAAQIVPDQIAEAAPAENPVLETEPLAVREAEEPIRDSEIEDFMAHARALAQKAALPPPEMARSVALPRWIAWMGVALVTLLICAGLALGNVARATQVTPDGGIAYRQVPPDAGGRLLALADSGDARAQTLLALAYLRGRYVSVDNQAALRWSTAAALQGEPVAQYLLGALLSKQDAPRAFSWFQEAALRGNLKAMHDLAIAYAEGEGVPEDDSRAAAWFGRAAAEGYVDSQFDLAVLFERGQGVAQSRVAALKWYLVAAAHGDGAAKARADQLRTQMPAEEVGRATTLAAVFNPQEHDRLANAVMSP